MIGSTQTAVATPTWSVSLVDTQAEFNRLQETWNSLLMAGPRPVPFLTWEWVSTWWKHFRGDSRLFVLVARDEKENVVGLAPLKIAVRRAFGIVPVRTVEFLGHRGSAVCADHLDFLASRDDRQTIVNSLVEAVFVHQHEWDAVVLTDLAEDSLVPEAFARRSAAEGWTSVEGPSEVCPYITLAGDWNTFLHSMKKKHRWFVRRKRELLAQDHSVHFTNEVPTGAIPRQFEVLKHLHGLSRARRGGSGNFRLSDYLAFHHHLAERMAEAGFLYLATLTCDDRVVAVGYGFHVGRTLFYYQTGYDTAFAPRGVGGILLGMIVEDAADRLRATEVDLLRGNEEYKYFWTQVERRTRTVLVWRRRLAGRTSEAEFLLRRGLSPWKRRVGTLWKSASQRFRSAFSDAVMHTSQEKLQL